MVDLSKEVISPKVYNWPYRWFVNLCILKILLALFAPVVFGTSVTHLFWGENSLLRRFNEGHRVSFEVWVAISLLALPLLLMLLKGIFQWFKRPILDHLCSYIISIVVLVNFCLLAFLITARHIKYRFASLTIFGWIYILLCISMIVVSYLNLKDEIGKG